MINQRTAVDTAVMDSRFPQKQNPSPNERFQKHQHGLTDGGITMANTDPASLHAWARK